MSRIHIEETYLRFTSPLKVRQKTDRFTLHWVGKIPASWPIDGINATLLNEEHQRGRGWAGVAYHYIILRNGIVERGRPREYQGAHDEGENCRAIGICIVSGPGVPPTPQQLDSLNLLLADLCDVYGQRAKGFPGFDSPICGHRDYEPAETRTECPGDVIYAMLPEIREQVTRLCGY
jgi:hypothetical protein